MAGGSIPRPVHDLLAHLAETVWREKRLGRQTSGIEELIDLVVFRVYGFSPEEVDATARYLAGEIALDEVTQITDRVMASDLNPAAGNWRAGEG